MNVKKKSMKINKYPDGSSYAAVEIGDKDITFPINSYEDLWHLNQYVEAYNNYYHREQLVVTIPNLLDAQADRRFNENESSGLKLVCELLNSMNARFKIFHPHNPEVVEALIDDVEIIDNSEFIYSILSQIKGYKEYDFDANILQDNLVLISSDAGGFKPLMKLAGILEWEGETYSASKSRTYNDGMSKIVQIVDREDFGGKDILIVDDISVYGGTFKGLAKLLRERNCGKLYLAVSHMTIQNLGVDPVTNYFDKVFTTNSKYDEYTYGTPFGGMHYPKNLEIIKLFNYEQH